VDQGSADMQTEAEQPQNQKNNENRPKHVLGETMVNPMSMLLVNLELPSQISDFAPEAVANRRH
jgi:hypothetical protein